MNVPESRRDTVLGLLRSLFRVMTRRGRSADQGEAVAELDRRAFERKALIDYQRAGNPMWRPDPARLRGQAERSSSVVEPK